MRALAHPDEYRVLIETVIIKNATFTLTANLLYHGCARFSYPSGKAVRPVTSPKHIAHSLVGTLNSLNDSDYLSVADSQAFLEVLRSVLMHFVCSACSSYGSGLGHRPVKDGF